jgi:8-oxo-dGTP diphosphatase
MSKYIEIISRAFIIRGDEVLLCRVKSKENHFFPGGHVELGENADDALRRELEEEIGKKLTQVKFVGICENTFEFKKRQHQEVNLVFEANVNSQKFSVLENHLEFGWYSLEKAKSMNILPMKLKKQFFVWVRDKKNFYIK